MNWDKYFHTICNAVATKSSCMSRQLGAILVRDNSIVATGFNGPPRGIPHCDNLYRREAIINSVTNLSINIQHCLLTEFDICPRKLMGFKSGEGLQNCNAAHAERNCLINAARLGISTLNTTLYLNATVLPCKDCFLELINAGITSIVVEEIKEYNDIEFLLKYSDIQVRTFSLE
jgi:dCMP deaminase